MGTQKIKVKVGYQLIGTLKVPLSIALQTSPHWLICGESGSGKSVLTQYLLNSLLEYSELELYVADFKASGDYDGVSEHYATFGDCIELVDEFYQRFQSIKQERTGEKILLLFDEYASAVIWANGQNKEVGKRLQSQIAEILMQGRSLPGGGSAWLWTVLQRPDAEYYSHGVRLNYTVTIIMKNVSKSLRQMLDISEEEIPAEHRADVGHGIILQSGKPPTAFIVPKLDLSALRRLLKRKADQKAQSSV